MTTIVTGLAVLLGTVTLLQGTWWTAVSTLAIRRPRGREAPRADSLRLAVVIPAHNEESLIGACIASIRRSAQHGRHRPLVLVVADNCVDATSAVAREAGALVLERVDLERRGKPFALDHALSWLATRRVPDAVLFVDADCEVNLEFIPAIAARLAGGAEAVQAHYAGSSGDDQPVERLRRLALLLVNWSRPLGIARLGGGVTIKGSGMALRWDLLQGRLGAYGIAEDAEMTLNLCERNTKVEFEPLAQVTGRMANSFAAARTQDRRWESGRLALMPKALRQGAEHLVRGRQDLALQAFEVGAPPLTVVVCAALLALGLGAGGFGPVWLPTLGLASLVSYVMTGLLAGRPSRHELAALAVAPRFLVYKLRLLAELAIRGRQVGWERTSRG